MSIFTRLFQRVHSDFANDWTEAMLRWTIVVWAAFIIILALLVRNKWILAGILAYEILP